MSRQRRERAAQGSNRRHFNQQLLGVAAAVGVGVAGYGGWWYFNHVSPEAAGASAKEKGIPTYGFELVKTYPHDKTAFSQGIVFDEGQFYESTGEYGSSTIRRVELATGKVLDNIDLHRDIFGEGLALIGDELYQLTWVNGFAFVRDKKTLREKRRLRYQGEGWGLTFDGTHAIMSNGSATLQFLDPKTFRVMREVTVKMNDQPLKELNELEYIDGEVWANVWHQDGLARIDPKTGQVVGWVNLSKLWPAKEWPDIEHCLNGIAYDPKDKRLFVTGKFWPKLYEIRVVAG
jgi:glutamine cyclotransferase